MYTVVVHRRAVRYLKKLPQDQQTRIKYVLNDMGNDPFGLSNVKTDVPPRSSDFKHLAHV